MDDVESPLPPSTPLLLVKPPVGLATPAVFKALDLGARSNADPRQLLAGRRSDPSLFATPPQSQAALLCLTSITYWAGSAQSSLTHMRMLF